MSRLLNLFFLFCFSYSFGQIIDCNLNYYSVTGNNVIQYRNFTNNTTGSTNITLPNGFGGLAVSQNLNGAGPNPTFYTVVNGIYFYYNGTTWVSTGHSSGGTAAVNPGGSGPYIYNIIGGTGRVYRYDGTGNAVLMLTIPNYGGPYDVIGDAEGNVYVLINSGGSRRLVAYDPNGQLICEYSLVNLPSSTAGGGYSVINGVLYVNLNASLGTFRGVFNNGVITFTSVPHFDANDYGSCAFPPLSTSVTGTNNSQIDMCANGTIVLTGTTTITNPVYSWTGPGIVSGANTNSIVVNQVGTYVLTVTSNGGLCTSTATVSHVVTAEGQQAVLSSPSPFCLESSPYQMTSTVPQGVWSASCGSCLSSTGVFNPTIAGPGTHTIVYDVDNSCGTSATRDVVVNVSPVIDAGLDVQICTGQSVVLTASGAVNYTWSGGVVNGVAFAPTISGIYSVIGVDANVCSATDDVSVNVSTAITPTFDVVAPICSGENLSPLPTVSTNGVEGIWTPALNNTATTTYTFTPFSPCAQGITMQIVVQPLIIAEFDVLQPICVGELAPVLANVSNNGVLGTWSSAVNNLVTSDYVFTPLSNECSLPVTVRQVVLVSSVPQFDLASTICQGDQIEALPTLSLDNTLGIWTPALNNQRTTTYTFVPNDFQCASNVSHTMVVNPLPVVSAGLDLRVCEGEEVRLLGRGAVFYSWSNGVQNGVPFIPESGQNSYTVTGLDANGCYSTADVVVEVVERPIIDLVVNQSGICIPSNVIISYSSSQPLNDCILSIGSDIISQDCNGLIELDLFVSGIYDVSLSTVSIDGCLVTHRVEDAILVEANPTALFTVSDVQPTILNPEVILSNLSEGAFTYSWDFGYNNARMSDFEPNFTYPDTPNSYIITLVALSANGCVDTFVQAINIVDVLIYYLPNSFTPDGNEYNQIFQPVFASGFDPYDFTMIIYNRWGEMVFETHDVSIGWNGEYGGKLCPSGVYTWTIIGRNFNNDGHFTSSGHVNLLR